MTLSFEKFGQLEFISDIPSHYALVDIDSYVHVPTIPFIHSIMRVVDVHPRSICYQRTRRGWHIVIELMEKLEPAELVALQSILGDDAMRSALNLMRTRKLDEADEFWRTRWNILYSHKLS